MENRTEEPVEGAQKVNLWAPYWEVSSVLMSFCTDDTSSLSDWPRLWVRPFL
ncbi:hypothetical protein Z947_2745 [Sulfitobacter geojensis]|nr:hypothetical protein Z947_2745 [Sulfitobacter geojensis]